MFKLRQLFNWHCTLTVKCMPAIWVHTHFSNYYCALTFLDANAMWVSLSNLCPSHLSRKASGKISLNLSLNEKKQAAYADVSTHTLKYDFKINGP